jgi:hypothetical protein
MALSTRKITLDDSGSGVYDTQPGWFAGSPDADYEGSTLIADAHGNTLPVAPAAFSDMCPVSGLIVVTDGEPNAVVTLLLDFSA